MGAQYRTCKLGSWVKSSPPSYVIHFWKPLGMLFHIAVAPWIVHSIGNVLRNGNISFPSFPCFQQRAPDVSLISHSLHKNRSFSLFQHHLTTFKFGPLSDSVVPISRFFVTRRRCLKILMTKTDWTDVSIQWEKENSLLEGGEGAAVGAGGGGEKQGEGGGGAGGTEALVGGGEEGVRSVACGKGC